MVSARVARGVGQLFGVVEVGHDPDRVVRAQRLDQLVGDARGQGDRNARREADHVERRDGAEAGEEALEARGGEGEGIAAAHDDVADAGVRLEPGEGRLERVERGRSCGSSW